MDVIGVPTIWISRNNIIIIIFYNISIYRSNVIRIDSSWSNGYEVTLSIIKKIDNVCYHNKQYPIFS